MKTCFHILAFIFPLVLLSCNRAVEHPAYITHPTYIAHAGGVIDGFYYTNCKEAVNNALDCGITHIELDLILTSDSQLVAAHDWERFRQMCQLTSNALPLSFDEFKSSTIYGKYTPLTYLDIDSIMDAHPEMYLVTDITSSPQILNKFIGRHKERTIVECFQIEDYTTLGKDGYTCYYSSCPPLRYKVTCNEDTPSKYTFWYLGAFDNMPIKDYNDGYGDSFAVFTLPNKTCADSIASLDSRIKYVYIDCVD